MTADGVGPVLVDVAVLPCAPAARPRLAQRGGQPDKHSASNTVPADDTHRLGEHTFLWFDDAQVFDHVEVAVVCLGDVHVQSKVVLTGHHFR